MSYSRASTRPATSADHRPFDVSTRWHHTSPTAANRENHWHRVGGRCEDDVVGQLRPGCLTVCRPPSARSTRPSTTAGLSGPGGVMSPEYDPAFHLRCRIALHSGRRVVLHSLHQWM